MNQPPSPISMLLSRHTRRREFIGELSGTAMWPLAAYAQQPEPMRRIGVLMSLAADDAEGQARIASFRTGLQQLGWIDGRNVQIDTRWAAGDGDRIRAYTVELVALAPDVIMVSGGAVAGALLQMTRTVPIVFTLTPDPVGAGFVESLSRPAGNATGFMNFEYRMGGKWLELLKEIVPGLTRAGVLRDPLDFTGTGQWDAMTSTIPVVYAMNADPVQLG